jgi:hypothetical protein
LQLARIRPAILIGLVLLLIAMPLAAQGGPAAPAGKGAELSVVLLTFGNGDQVYEKFGHNAIWIHDPLQGTDRVYNYGLFDFHSPGYWGRFVKGTWLYQIGVADMYQTMAEYEYLNRTVTAQELNLTPVQKLQLQSFLDWNARPENAQYRYDYFRDNCSTRVRDAIDRVLGGQIQRATAGIPTNTTFRWHSRRLLSDGPVVYTGLEAGLGEAADRPIDAWEEMFLPEKVQQRVRNIQVTLPDGTRAPLVLSERALYTARGRAPEPSAPPSWIAGYLLAGAAFGLAVAGLAAAAARSHTARFGFSLLTVAWGFMVGMGGLLLLGLWLFTDHTIAHRNENLFQFSVFALPLVILAPAVAYGARWAVRPARALAFVAAASSLLGFVLQLLPGLDQVNGEIIALLLPAHLAVAWAVVRVASSRQPIS